MMYWFGMAGEMVITSMLEIQDPVTTWFAELMAISLLGIQDKFVTWFAEFIHAMDRHNVVQADPNISSGLLRIDSCNLLDKHNQ